MYHLTMRVMIIKEKLNSITYHEYIHLVENLVNEGKTTGSD